MEVFLGVLLITVITLGACLATLYYLDKDSGGIDS